MTVEKEQAKGNWFKDKTIRPRKLVADIKGFLSETEYPPDLAGPTRKFTDFLRAIMFSAATTEPGYTYEIPLPCRRRPHRKKCAGKILIYVETDESNIHWGCPVCGGSGTITGEKTQRELGVKTKEADFRKETLH